MFFEIHYESLHKLGEELCGDKVKTARTPDRTIAVLSDGLGSGVKANILATLTSEILVKMLLEDAPLPAVIETVVGTLPMCKVRKVAYATFTVVELRQDDGSFRVINFDNPPPLCFRKGRPTELELVVETVQGRRIGVGQGRLELGDFLGVLSDGVAYAGLGVKLNFGWGRKDIAKFLETIFLYQGGGASQAVARVMAETRRLYGGEPGDDATFLGIAARRRRSVMVFTGPPLDQEQDGRLARRLLEFPGRRVVCGGTTAQIVANELGEVVETDLATLRKEIPPVGYLSQVDLCTEGILTMARCLELLSAVKGAIQRLPGDRHGAALLARELLQADDVRFLVGQRVNEFYQNPILPTSVSIRRGLVERLADALRAEGKAVEIEWC